MNIIVDILPFLSFIHFDHGDVRGWCRTMVSWTAAFNVVNQYNGRNVDNGVPSVLTYELFIGIMCSDQLRP